MFLMLVASAIGSAKEIALLVGINNLSKVVSPGGGNRPQVSIRFNTDGTIDDATGDTGGALSYSQTGTWLLSGRAPRDNTDWEVKGDIQTEDVTNANTFSGSVHGGSFVDISTNPLVTLTKDTNSEGASSATIIFTLRRKTSPSNNSASSTITLAVDITA